MNIRVRSLCAVLCALQTVARQKLFFCRLFKPAQAGLEPQAPAFRGLLRLRLGSASSAVPTRLKSRFAQSLIAGN